jgi:molybdopterin/thiamine biosynthesis adenylyltransferase
MPASTPLLGSSPAMVLRSGAGLWAEITSHILPADGDEHGGALLCGTAISAQGRRLLARRFIPAIDGVDYVAGTLGYRALTPAFIRRALRLSAESSLVCLFVHGHGQGNSVAFSSTDLASHERGYRALLDIAGQTVGALVLATNATAGDIWMQDGGRAELQATTLIGTNLVSLTPQPVRLDGHRYEDDRQARLFGDRGQQILRGAKVGIIGVGGAGMLAVEWLSHLGVGQLVVIDPDRVDITNLPRLPGATRWDARALLTAENRPRWVRSIGERTATRKVRVAQRLARRAGQGTVVTTFPTDVRDPTAAAALTDCDYLILAADSATARHLVNVIAHQYLIPTVQVGVKIPVDPDGTVGNLFTAVRPVLPDGGCLRCAGLIDPDRLAVEAMPKAQRAHADYGTGQPAPSVITLNAIAVSHALTRLVLGLTGLTEHSDVLHIRHHPRLDTQSLGQVRRDPDCSVCGLDGVTGLGDLRSLPLPYV